MIPKKYKQQVELEDWYLYAAKIRLIKALMLDVFEFDGIEAPAKRDLSKLRNKFLDWSNEYLERYMIRNDVFNAEEHTGMFNGPLDDKEVFDNKIWSNPRERKIRSYAVDYLKKTSEKILNTFSIFRKKQNEVDINDTLEKTDES